MKCVYLNNYAKLFFIIISFINQSFALLSSAAKFAERFEKHLSFSLPPRGLYESFPLEDHQQERGRRGQLIATRFQPLRPSDEPQPS